VRFGGGKRGRDSEGVYKNRVCFVNGIFRILFLISILRGIIIVNYKGLLLICFWPFLNY
jgi:hypothetical protein